MYKSPNTKWENKDFSAFLYKDLTQMDLTLPDEDDIVETIQFQGFDPIVIAKEAVRVFEENKSGEGTFLESIKAICMICVIRGFDWDKVKQKASEKGIVYINNFIKLFRMTLAKRVTLPPKTLTPQRLCSAFPLIYLTAFAKYGKALSLGPHQIPKGMMTPLAGIFVRDFNAWLKWAKEYHFIVNKGSMVEWPKSLAILRTQRNTQGSYAPEVVTKIQSILEGNNNVFATLGGITTNDDVADTQALTAAIESMKSGKK